MRTASGVIGIILNFAILPLFGLLIYRKHKKVARTIEEQVISETIAATAAALLPVGDREPGNKEIGHLTHFPATYNERSGASSSRPAPLQGASRPRVRRGVSLVIMLPSCLIRFVGTLDNELIVEA